MAKFNVTAQGFGLATMALDMDMVQLLREEIDRVGIELTKEDTAIVLHFRECLELKNGTDNEMAGYSGSFTASAMINEMPDGTVLETIVFVMNYHARMDLAEYIADHDANDDPMNSTLPVQIRALVNGLRHPGDRLTPRQRYQAAQAAAHTLVEHMLVGVPNPDRRVRHQSR